MKKINQGFRNECKKKTIIIIATVFSYCFVNAQVTYKDLVPDSVIIGSNPGTTYSIDLNNDGINDFKITNIGYPVNSIHTQCTNGSYSDITISPLNTNTVLNDINSYATCLGKNVIVNGTLSKWTGTANQLLYHKSMTCTPPGAGCYICVWHWQTSINGNWIPSDTDKFLAVKIIAGAKNYYGWVRIKMNSDNSLTVKDYACSNTAETQILTGQTTNSYLTTSAINTSPFCSGSNINISYTSYGLFNSTNKFSVQLSDSNGSFANPLVIGSISGIVSGTITCHIPAGKSGTGFRVRAVSSSPALIAFDNGVDLTINTSPPPSNLTIATSDPTTFCSGGWPSTLMAPQSNRYIYTWERNGSPVDTLGNQYYYWVYVSGSYKCLVNDGCGTVSTNSINMVVNVSPVATITTNGPTSFCKGGNVILTAGAGNNYAYQWLKNGVNITGATSKNYKAAKAGSYSLQVTDKITKCYTWTGNIDVTILSCSALSENVKNEMLQSDQILITPNPLLHSTAFSFTLNQSSNVSIKIFDEAGRLIKIIVNTQMQPGTHRLTWNALNETGQEVRAGIYFLRFEAGNRSETRKLMVVN